MKKLMISMMTLAVLAGCTSTDRKEQTASTVEERTPPPVNVDNNRPPPKIVPVERTAAIVANPLTDPKNILSKRSIYFDYDSNAVKDEYKPVVTAHARYLSDNRSAKVTIQGNTDERGSREYNLALGQRRADSVKQMLTVLGVQEGQMESVSFGEEKPKATGSDNAAFAENRRDDIVYQGE